jgi:integrase
MRGGNEGRGAPMRRTGHIRERSPGSFELRYGLRTDPASGKRRTATVTVRGSRKDAEKELRRLLRALDTGEHVDPNRTTVREWLATWIDTVKPEVSTRTHESYTSIVNNHLIPAFGNFSLTKLAPADIQKVYTRWSLGGRRDRKEGPLAPQTRRFVHRVLNASLNRAVELQLIPRNPAQVLRKRLPKDEHREMATLSAEQSQQLLDTIRPTPLYWPVLIALATGMRRGEILAVRWRNVDLGKHLILVVDSVAQTKGGLQAKAPKNGRARKITVPAFAVEELRRLKREQAENLIGLGVRQTAETRVCTQPDGRPISPNVLTNYFSRVAKRLAIPIHFHSLRHTHATQLLLEGVHPKVAQERLGHATVAMTLDIYSHVTERLRDDAAAKIDAALRRR